MAFNKDYLKIAIIANITLYGCLLGKPPAINIKKKKKMSYLGQWHFCHLRMTLLGPQIASLPFFKIVCKVLFRDHHQ